MGLLHGSDWRYGLRGFWTDTSGMALIYVTVALPAIVGLSLLAIDVGRLTTLQSSLQHGTDALALAAAAELDQRPSAIERAETAIVNLVTTNASLFATTAVIINPATESGDESIISTCYLAALPSDDATPINSDDCLSEDPEDIEDSSRDARFVQVRVTPQEFTTIFPATFVGAVSNTAHASAEAVAGFQAAVCNFTPLFMCNPFEPPDAGEDPAAVFNDYGLFDHIQSNAYKRRLIALKSHDQQWAPGNFGFLEPADGPGANRLAEAVAAVKPEACFIFNNIATQTGNIESMKKAFNVRFDLYPNGNIGGQSATSFPPAENVRKGYVIKKKNGNGQPNACNDNNPVSSFDGSPHYDQAMGLPRDSCFTSGSCTDSDGRMGNGDWGGDTNSNAGVPDFEQYWAVNHPGIARPTKGAVGIVPEDDPAAGQLASNGDPPTRYAIYRYEIDNGLVGNASVGPTYVERGTPQCVASPETNPDRRIIYGAIINCGANGLNGGKTRGLQAVAFGKFFMTEPMDGSNASNTTLWTELIDVVEPGTADSVARDIVQLYR